MRKPATGGKYKEDIFWISDNSVEIISRTPEIRKYIEKTDCMITYKSYFFLNTLLLHIYFIWILPFLHKVSKKSTCLRYIHKVHIYTEYHSVCPLVGIGTAPPPQAKGGRAHSPAGEGWGSPNSDDWRKSLALCLLCGYIAKSHARSVE